MGGNLLYAANITDSIGRTFDLSPYGNGLFAISIKGRSSYPYINSATVLSGNIIDSEFYSGSNEITLYRSTKAGVKITDINQKTTVVYYQVPGVTAGSGCSFYVNKYLTFP
jgi:hypothetical protein